MNARRGAVVWITGLPSSGKSTLAERLRVRLHDRNTPCILLDGDAVRSALVPAPGYGPGERDAFYCTLGNLAGSIAAQDVIVIVAATAPRRAHREHARRVAPRFVEVYLDVPLEECERRDSKGLYARARAGAAPHLPGGPGVPYEPPAAPEVVARAGDDDRAIEEILRVLGMNQA